MDIRSAQQTKKRNTSAACELTHAASLGGRKKKRSTALPATGEQHALERPRRKTFRVKERKKQNFIIRKKSGPLFQRRRGERVGNLPNDTFAED